MRQDEMRWVDSYIKTNKSCLDLQGSLQRLRDVSAVFWEKVSHFCFLATYKHSRETKRDWETWVGVNLDSLVVFVLFCCCWVYIYSWLYHCSGWPGLFAPLSNEIDDRLGPFAIVQGLERQRALLKDTVRIDRTAAAVFKWLGVTLRSRLTRG